MKDEFHGVQGGGGNSGIRRGLTNKSGIVESGLARGLDQSGSRTHFLQDNLQGEDLKQSRSRVSLLGVNRNAKLIKTRNREKSIRKIAKDKP